MRLTGVEARKGLVEEFRAMAAKAGMSVGGDDSSVRNMACSLRRHLANRTEVHSRPRFDPAAPASLSRQLKKPAASDGGVRAGRNGDINSKVKTSAVSAMNYQHAFHAGNFADVHKHVALARILLYLQQKPAAFRVIDSHAGAARYDLCGPEATRSGEWHNGIARLWEACPQGEGRGAGWPLLQPYLEAVAACNPDGRLHTYPGSPALVQHLMRQQDRLIACEIEPRSFVSLTAALHGDRRAKALAIDGWTALGAYVPPKERRGLVLVDPPYEDSADFTRLSAALAAAHRKWRTGTYALWYPIKGRDGPDALARQLRRLNIANILRSELLPGSPRAEGGLAGSGLIVVNPPFTLERDLRIVLPVLVSLLAPRPGQESNQEALPGSNQGSQRGSHRLDWLTPDR
jgi:23S rRNA (adenine2030-N6)-methyltransferase